ncbi:glucosylceramide transporter ABCA12 [Ranitomeya variabilis]|uniref:glucosylceramide transporter ABCA12 n=1 Tax=Ranitomeya variabilis TaxID=490064 RepID=UPI004056B7B1
MASFLHQLKVLLWKNWLSVFRQPVWSVVLIFWPVVIFFIFAMTRIRYPPTQVSDCYLAPRNLQSTGMVPFLQSFLCDSDVKCANKSYIPKTLTPSNRLQKRSVDSGGGSNISQTGSSNDQIATLWDGTAGENWQNILNNISVVKTAVEELRSGDIKRALCTTITLLPPAQQSTFRTFCNSNQTLTSLGLQMLFSQASGSNVFTTLHVIATQIENVQSNTVLWNILLMLPEWIKNPSLIYEGEFHLPFPEISSELADLQSCVKYIVKTINGVQNQSSTNNPLGILEIVLDQSMNDMKSCISMFKRVPCGLSGSSQCWLEMEQTLEKIYWLMSSLTNKTSSNVCEFNGVNFTCNGTINLDIFLQSVLDVVKEISNNSSDAIIRILGQMLTSFQDSGLQNIFIKSIQNQILNLSSEEQKMTQNLLSLLVSVINETISEIALQPPSYHSLVFNIIQNIVRNINRTYAMENLVEQKDITKVVFSLVTDILQIAQNWNNVSLVITFPQNGSNEGVKELEGLLNNLLSQNSTELYYNYSTTLLNVFAVFFAGGEKEQVMQAIHYFLNFCNGTINVPGLVNTLEIFYDLLNLNETVNRNILELYIKQLSSFISSSQINQTIIDLSFLFTASQKLSSFQTSEIGSAALELLTFFYPSSLYNISKGSSSLVSTLLNALSSNIPLDQQHAISNFTDTILLLMELIEKCNNDSMACDSAVSGFEVLAINVVNVITNIRNGTLNLEISNETLMEMEKLTDVQMSLINHIFSLFWNLQNTTDNLSGDLQNVYQDILSVSQLILNITKDPNASTVHSDLEKLKNFTQLIGNFQKVASANVTHSLLQIMNLQKDFQCANQNLLCILNLTSKFLHFLETLQVPKPLMEQVLAGSSIAQFWLSEINTTADVYQQMITLYELTSVALLNEPTLQKILWTLTNISKTIEDIKMENTSFSIVEDLTLSIFKVLQEGNFLNASLTSLNINSTQLKNVQSQVEIIQWYVIYIKNQTENHNLLGDPYVLYRLIQISLIDILSSLQNWVEFLNMSNLSFHEIENMIQLLSTNETGAINQLENVIHLSDILQEINSIQGLNTVDFTTVWQIINRLMSGELNGTQIDEMVKILQAAITTHNTTEGEEFLQLYNLFLEILNQIYFTENMNVTEFLQFTLDSFQAMDCHNISRIFTAVYKIILNTSNQTSTWVDELFFSNFTFDVCTLLQWNNSQDDWLTLLQTSRGLVSYAIPLVPDNMSKYLNAVEYILKVAAEFIAEPALTHKNIMNIISVVPTISELFTNSTMDWIQNGTFQKLAYFLLDLAWTSPSSTEILLLKVYNFTFTMVQDIQDMLVAQPASSYKAWVSFALDVLTIIMNGTQDSSSEETLLKQVWDFFNQNGLKTAIISVVHDRVLNNSSANSGDAILLDHLLQLVFNITDSLISDTTIILSNGSTNVTITGLQMALNSFIETFVPQPETFTLGLGDAQTGMNMSMIFSELQLLLSSMTTMQVPTKTINIEANLFNLILNYTQILLSSNNTKYMELFLDAQKIVTKFAQMNTTISVQELSAIFANYLPIFVGSNNETQASLYTILNMWQYLNNLTAAQSIDLNNITELILPMFQSLVNENTNVSELMSWLVNVISNYIPTAEKDELHKVANATLHLIDAVQTCRINILTCPDLIKGIQNFISDVNTLDTFMKNRSLVNSSFLHFGLYNQSQITLINEIFLLLSYATGLPYNASSSQNGIYGDVLTLKDWIFNTTMENNPNFTTALSPQNILEVLNSVNITKLLLKVDNVLQSSTCANDTGNNELLCKLKVVLQLAQLLSQVPLDDRIQSDVLVISSLLRQWVTINFNSDSTANQQLIDLYNVTILTLHHQPILQAINTSLVNIVHILQDMGLVQNISMNETEIATSILSEMIKQLESGPNIYNLSCLLQYNISESLESIQLKLDMANWLMLHLQNQTGIIANSSGANIIHILAQWIINNYQHINILIRDVQAVVNSLNPLSPNATIDALKTIVEDLLDAFLPQSEDEHLIESLKIVLNVTRFLINVTGPDTIKQIHIFINNFLTFQSDISNDPTKLLNVLSALNQSSIIPKIRQFIKFFIVSNYRQLLDALKMFDNFDQMTSNVTVQDLSAILVKYLQFNSETTNKAPNSLNAVFNLWQYLNNLTLGESNNISSTAINMLPFLQSNLLLNENTNISQIISWLVNIISRHAPPEDQERFEKAANASLIVIEAMEACVGISETCTDLIKGMENFLVDVALFETFVHNRTLANNSLLLFESYNQSQIVLVNELFMMLSYAMGHTYNTSTVQNTIYEDLLKLKSMFLNTSMEEDLNVTITYLQSISEVLTSVNISQVVCQVKILLNTSSCTNQTDVEPFLCKLNMTLQLVQFLSQLPLAQTTHGSISIISSIIRQWLSHLDRNMPSYQQLLDLYNVTILAFDQQFTLQAINTSLINITYILHDMGILQNISVNETDITMTILSGMIQLFDSGPRIDNISSILQSNISGVLQAMQSQLHTMNWLLLQVVETKWNFNSSLTGNTIYSIVQWIQKNNQNISLILGDVELMMTSLNDFFNLGFINISFIWNLFNESIQPDSEVTWLLLQEMESANISLILTSINQLQQTLRDMKGLGLEYTFYNNIISQKEITIIIEGIKILNNIQAKGTIGKEDIYQMYNFTYLLVQDEWSWVPFQNISAMEAELLDVFYLAMTPFLGNNSSQAYSGNCTAQEVLQILIQTIFKNSTTNKSQELATCNWQFIFNSSDATASSNHTLDDMIYLALQSSPIFHTVCSKDNLLPLAEELTCLVQVMRMSTSVLAELSIISGFQAPLIQSLNDSVTFIFNNIPDHNSTVETETQIMKNLAVILFNQSSPVHLFIQFIRQHYNSSLQTSDLQQVWTQISKIVKTTVITNGSVEGHIYELIETAVNLTIQPNRLESWQNLDNISMSWTDSNIDVSLSLLETLRKALVSINGVTDDKALQIHQAIASLMKNPMFSVLFNVTNAQLINPTISSVAECTAVVNALANFSNSIWSIFGQAPSNMEELLSNFGFLACNTLYVQSTNYSWTPNLEIINNILSNLANYVPAEMNGYFTAIEKIISFVLEIFQSPNISQEKLIIGVYELFIQELRIFNNTAIIADWLEKIPVTNVTSILLSPVNTVKDHQVIVLEAGLLNLLSGSLKAESYSQGISVLSDFLLNMANIINSLTNNSGIIQQLMNATTQFTVTVQIPPLTEPYETAMNCVKNVAADLTDHQTGHLDVAIQDLFTPSNELANGSMVPELLNEKIYQLQNVTAILCGLNGSNNTYCYVSCQYFTLLQDVANITKTGIQVVQTAQRQSASTIIKSVLDSILLSIESELNQMISSVLPVSDLSNITSLLINFANVTNGTSEDIQVPLGTIFHNSSHVEEQLRQVVNLSQPTVSALMSVQIPSNKIDIIDCFFTLYQCRTNLSLVAEPLQVFCNLPPDKGYQTAIIFFQNIDILQLIYRMVVPSTWQKDLDIIKAALINLLQKMDEIFADLPSQEELNSVLGIMKKLLGVQPRSLRQRRSVDLLLDPSNRAITASFTDITKLLCNGNYKGLSQALYSLYPTLQSSAKQSRAKTLDQLYGIPTNNSFCLELFTNLVKTSSGASYWILLKPLLYGQILYSPNTAETQKIMEKTSNKILEVENYKKTFNTISTNIQKLMDNWKYITEAGKLIATLQGILNNTVINGFLEEFLQINTTDLSAKLTTANSYIQFLIDNESYIRVSQALSQVLDNLLSCMSYNRITPFSSATEMLAEADELQTTNELFAAVTFNLPSGTSRNTRSASGLPKHMTYSITMRSLLSEDTNYIRDSYWVPGPHTTVNTYSRGFVYLQENIDRAIIEMQTNKSLDDVGVQYQPMPFPCYKKNSFLYSLSFSLPIALMISWVLFIAAFVKKLVHEKELRLHEYMKMMGINSCSHFFAWFIECACFLIITVAILILILKFGKLLPHSNGFLMFLFFLDYSLTVIAMSYLISVFFHNTNVAALSGSLIYIITFFPFIVVVSKETDLSFASKTLLSLFSPTALSYATQYIIRYEEQDEGIQWHNMYTSPMASDTFCFGWLCWIMLIDAMIYFIVGWYIRIVFPGKYGIAVPWYYPVLPSFWMECCGLQNVCSRKPSGLMISNLVAHGIPEKKGDDLYPHEEEPADLNVGVSLHGLTKIYQSKAAVENLNLKFYEGHITSLLGHNGAGKTTTLSMLTGLFSASSGTIYVYGNDIRTHLDQARKNMGVCMQYDVLFDYLTTKEHLLLYGSTKAPQWGKRQLHEEVKRTLKDTGLYKHRHKPVKALSGGMRRKLSICIALIGGSKVVILDEPTTGVDPCSRRSIWEVISKNKKDKTIILSTHHLDEAEVLSDRIAFLERGGLRCCGTPRFLKEKFGSGYRLTLTKKFPDQKDENVCDSERVTALIQSHIPEAKLKEDVGGELAYVLPPFSAEVSSAYLSLLHDLDNNLSDLHIGCYGISDTTIEEVFLKLTEGLDEENDLSSRVVPISKNDNLIVDDESSTNSYNSFNRDDQPLTRMEHAKGFKLLLKKIMAMFIKRFHNSKRNWKGLISQILLPILFVIAAMGLGSLSMGYAEYPELLLTPELYGTKEQVVVFGLSNNTSEDLMNAMSSFPGIDNACLDQNSQCLAENSLGSWNYTGDQTFTYGNCNCSTGYSACNAAGVVPPHRMTYSKQTLYNLSGKSMESYLISTALQFVQKRYGGWSFGIPASQIISFVPVSENLTLNKVWYNNEGPHSLPSFLNSFSNFLLRANLPSNESSQYSISVYSKPLPGNIAQGTTTTILVNTLVALSILVGYSITTASFVTYVVKEHDNGSKRLQHIAGIGEVCYWLTNCLYDLAIYFIPVALSLAMIAAFKLPAFYDFPNLGAVSILFILFGYATFSWMYLIAGTFKNPGMAFISYVCINLFIGINTIISSSVVYMLIQQKSSTDSDFKSLNDTYNALINVFKIFPQFCFGYGLISLSQQQAISDQLEIFGNYEKVDVFGMNILGYMYVAMTVQGTFCFILRLLISDGIIYSVKTFFKNTCLKAYYSIGAKNPDEDEDVTAERNRVESGNAYRDLLLLKGLTKVFHQVHRNTIAVNNMTLGIPPGECFGLLGVNGAGKTTTFKMLTGDLSPSSGNIQIRNHIGNLVNVLGFKRDWSSFGYCPQEDALDELMTGEEHLYYYARIYGVPEKKLKHVTNQLLRKLQLVQYKDRITANYSCGTRRKLSTALALVGKPSILLLDEPSSGMDPKTKRHLWKIISEEVREKCAVILTSHSMEECEALCTRLAIMVRGTFQCIGSLQHIKSRFGSGFTVKMHLKDFSVSIKTITNFMHSQFPNTYLKEQHFTMAEYHVPVSAGGVASIFDLLESNKKHLNIIHFSVSQTTLDEVFINFAQSQTSPDNSRESGHETPQEVVVA